MEWNKNYIIIIAIIIVSLGALGYYFLISKTDKDKDKTTKEGNGGLMSSINSSGNGKKTDKTTTAETTG